MSSKAASNNSPPQRSVSPLVALVLAMSVVVSLSLGMMFIRLDDGGNEIKHPHPHISDHLNLDEMSQPKQPNQDVDNYEGGTIDQTKDHHKFHLDDPVTDELSKYEAVRDMWVSESFEMAGLWTSYSSIVDSSSQKFATPLCLLTTQARERYLPLTLKESTYLVYIHFNGTTTSAVSGVEETEHLVVPNLGTQLIRLAGYLGKGRVSYVIQAQEAKTEAERQRDDLLKLLKTKLESLHVSVKLNLELKAFPTISTVGKFTSEKKASHAVTLSASLFCISDVLELLQQQDYHSADHMCGLSFTWDPKTEIYGYIGAMIPTLSSQTPFRDMGGNIMFHKNDNWFKQIFEGDSNAEGRFDMHMPVQVISCEPLSASVWKLPFPKGNKVQCSDGDSQPPKELLATSRTGFTGFAKFSHPLPPSLLSTVRKPPPASLAGGTPLSSYVIAHRDAVQIAILRPNWSGGERIDDQDQLNEVEAYVQTPWKFGGPTEPVEFAKVAEGTKIDC